MKMQQTINISSSLVFFQSIETQYELSIWEDSGKYSVFSLNLSKLPFFVLCVFTNANKGVK